MSSSVNYFLILFSVLLLLGFFASVSLFESSRIFGYVTSINSTGNLVLPDYDYTPSSDNSGSDNYTPDSDTYGFSSEGVERYFPASVPGVSEFDVTLFVKLPAENQAFLIDETFPDGFELVDAEGADSSEPNHLKWVDYNSSSEEISLSYRLKSPDSVAGFTFSGDFVFEDLVLQEISGDTLLSVTFADLCEGKADGSSCGIDSYCCGGVCNTAPDDCPTCQFSGACCSGTQAVCCNEPQTVECGINYCPDSACISEGSNTFVSYSSTCGNFCTGTGVCDTCECESEEVVCGTDSVCDVDYECIPCASERLNCDIDAQNGCEVNYLTDSANCGSCGNKCSTGYSCDEGECKKDSSGAPQNADSQDQAPESGFSLTDPLSLLMAALVLSAVSTAGYVALKNKLSVPPVSPETPGPNYPSSSSNTTSSLSKKSLREKLMEKAVREDSRRTKQIMGDSEKDNKVKTKLSDIQKNLKALQDSLKDMK